MFKSLIKTPVNLLRGYNKLLLNSPYKTKMTTAGCTYFIADWICQNKIEKKESDAYSPLRSLRQASVGCFFAAPSLHAWHSLILPKIVTYCTGNVTRVLVSVFLNESVLAAYFISCLLFSFEALKKMDVNAGVENVKGKFVPALETSVKFWTGISFINYGLMPVHLRPVFVSCWSIVWQSYLSYISNNKVVSLPTAFVKEEEEINYDFVLSKSSPNSVAIYSLGLN
jgi:protein Mpv17